MKIQGKIWGETRNLFANSNVEVHLIDAIQGGFCSQHYHKTKYNRFIVLRGKLKITIWKDYNGETLEDVTILQDGMECTVEPGDKHMFEALEDTRALEVYYVDLNPNDIMRSTHGGTNV